MPRMNDFSERQRQAALEQRRQREQSATERAYTPAFRRIVSRPAVDRETMQQMVNYFAEQNVVRYRWSIDTGFTYGWPQADKTRLSEWMNEEGEYVPIKELSLSQLKEAVKRLEKGSEVGGQEHKVISLKKELQRRTAGKNRLTRRFKKTYPAKKGGIDV